MPMQVVPMIGGSGPNHCFIQELGVPVATAGSATPTRACTPRTRTSAVDLYLQHAKHVARILEAFGAAR